MTGRTATRSGPRRSPPAPCHRLGADGGSATVLVLALSLVLLMTGVLLTALGAVAVARHRAAAAADLSALAAARALQAGADPCAAARRVAVAAGAGVDVCSVDGAAVRVVAFVRPAGPLGQLGVAHAQARAGPVGLGTPGPPSA